MDVGANTSNSPFEDFLCEKASALEQPILGTFELNPTCNMNCEMCYIRMNQSDVDRLGGLRSVEEWVGLAKEMMDEGLLFLLITGGEPLLYPHFKELFVRLQEMGLFLTMNTNGTLIDEEMAKFLHDHMIRRLQITLYGKDDETYGRLCHNPKGFTQLSQAIKYLKKYDIPVRLNCSLTKDNYMQLEDFHRIAEEWELPIEISYYMFPPNRKIDKHHFEEHRMPPEIAAKCAFNIHTHKKNEEERKQFLINKLAKINENASNNPVKEGFICRAANASFWVNWKGNLTPCGIMNEPEYYIYELGFAEAWKQIKAEVKTIYLSEECYKCKYSEFCPHCAAAEPAENGQFGITPKYQCEFTEAYVQLLRDALASYENE